MRIKKTPHNRYSLTVKQQLVIEIMVSSIKAGRGIKARQAHQSVYNVNSANSASVLASKNFAKPNFHQALLEKLEKANIIGTNSKVEQRLTEGLDAVNSEGMVDYVTRFRYVQEINKVVGAYLQP